MSEANEPDGLVVECPFCHGRLTVDAETGTVLDAEEHRRQHAGIDDALEDVQRGAGRRADDFDRAFASEQQRGDLLDKMFRKAKEKVGDDDTAPPDPFGER